ncbi:MAG: flagellin [Clostridiales bacterium 43-6]|nr:MAG: flagellin [Clostridiales bacterium 43-6]
MRINHNLSAVNTYRQYSANTVKSTKSMEKLSSGLRINRAADDAAGLSISEKMRSQIRGLSQAVKNTQDGVSYIQTAEGALNEVSDMLSRMKELTVQSANGTYSTDDTTNIGKELTALSTAIKGVLSDTKFNGKAVFTASTDIAYGEDGSTKLTIAAAGFKAADVPDSTASATDIDDAITAVNTDRATYGAQQNQLEHVMNNLSTTSENLQAAESRIRDVDMANEMMEFTKNNILVQAAQSMLSQANQQPQAVLQLLRG